MADNLPTLIETLRKAEAYFADRKIPSPRLEAQLLFAHFLGLRRIDLFTQPERPLVATELETLREAMRRKIAGVPTAYILGSRDFFGRSFAVSPAVLIPRPETEELVEHVLSLKPGARHVVDAGSGSGCIGITLAAELKAAELTLIDISSEALQVAAANAAQLLNEKAVQLTTLCADFCERELSLTSPAELIVSNPPYVLPEEFAGLERSVRDHEPKVALVAERFEELHRGLIAFAWRNLTAGGIFALETHPQKSNEVAEWVREAGFVSVEIRNDLAARPHFVLAHK
ncbi:MAG: peptide chain release factor N(5)-glutamine methyltransferase [Turneriella sp.]